MKKLSVAHLVSLHTVGGVENFFTNFSTSTNSQFEHHVFLGHDHVHPFYLERLKAAGVITHSMRKHRGLYLPRIPQLLRYHHVKNICKKHSIDSLILWNKLENFPADFPETLKRIHFERGSAWLVKDNPAIKEYLEKCHGMLSNSEAGFHIINQRWNVARKPTSSFAYNGINPLYTQGSAPENKLGEKIILGFAGRLVPLKGWILALQTVQELNRQSPNKYELLIAGDGRHRELMLRLITERGLTDCVRYMGLVKDMREFFQQINIFLHTSLREPQGNIALESQALARPVIGAMVDGNPEIIRQGETGILIEATIDPKTFHQIDPSLLDLPPFVLNPLTKHLVKPMAMDPLVMAARVREMVEDSTRFNQMAKNAADWARSEFEFEKRKTSLAHKILEIVL